MRLQSHQNGCGPSTVANIMKALGWDHATEDWVCKRAKLVQGMGDPHPAYGTVEGQIKRCLAAFKIPHFEFTCHDPNVATSALRGFLNAGHPVMIACEGDEHWACVLGTLGERFSVVDSADSELNVFYDPVQLVNWWKSNTEPPKFYGIVVTSLKPKKVKGK